MTPPAKKNDFAGMGAWATVPKGGPSSTLTFGSSTSASSSSSGGKSGQGPSPMLEAYKNSPTTSLSWSHLKVTAQ
ncbi:hypothetical protein N7448_010637 [Penicillium atrosanguineum]|uniref:Uncharacterized protein n=1 Tax=Penicillium atrosanguineum TaxID=1132637 RepID=A0A9W9PM99_9EURO|nr:uncharacterized protein N7443_007859 [Penicillium atrosanguineum]KAJ5118929.1 hypothetical protein N7526_010566 [Penicillium atrosanguineum]KAJ5119968.1 hypothetical protein N7448_010637 [Penicillium atrosanguineum]KAJ5296966.1 hypothetical protein N7443_007859 [Penicillium atrosanguineum]KAJ5299727.1 hypothetical protein N7476_011284 [Penicillium atrosanguineum]